MEIEEKIELNKLIRKYEGHNKFILSLKKQLKTNKYLKKVEYKGRTFRVLSEKQYDAFKAS
jgi:predicted RNase H-like nuclease (RuvC/YqgF family)